MQQTDCMGHRPAGGHCWPRGPEAGGSPVLDIGRRQFITLLGGAAGWPLVARAQQPAMPVVGFLRSTSATASADLVAAFRRGLTQAGYFEGQDLSIAYHLVENPAERTPGV